MIVCKLPFTSAILLTVIALEDIVGGASNRICIRLSSCFGTLLGLALLFHLLNLILFKVIIWLLRVSLSIRENLALDLDFVL